LRDRTGELIARDPEDLGEALVTEYAPGAGIGWHRDAPPFGIVVGVSLLSECTMQFRPWPVNKAGEGASRAKRSKPLAQVLAPRSVYVLDGAARSQWQHHIPAAKELRYSITFRTLRKREA
jgi:alkylated DNA repair dioxygenase AlkB